MLIAGISVVPEQFRLQNKMSQTFAWFLHTAKVLPSSNNKRNRL